jgi:hypothetical protein
MEPLIYESFIGLQAQVDALAAGTNPVVYFPPGTEKMPALPEGALSLMVAEDCDGDGTYYYSPKYTNSEVIYRAVRDGIWWKVLGFVQSKEEAAKGYPGLVVARDSLGNEIKSAAVNVHDLGAILTQGLILRMQFPQASVMVENMQGVLLERLTWAMATQLQ